MMRLTCLKGCGAEFFIEKYRPFGFPVGFFRDKTSLDRMEKSV